LAMTIPFRSGNGFSEQGNNPSSLHVPMVYEQMPLEPVQWEYHVLVVDTREMDIPGVTQLNELGAQGWLLVGILDQRAHGSSPRGGDGQMTSDYVSRVVERESQRASSLVYYYFVRQKNS
jgi:hypothetical protein